MSSNNRASLLAGLRTGGVRQPSQMPFSAAPNVTSFARQELPMTASISGSFNQMHSSNAQAQAQVQAQKQALQMQMMQMEILRLQALQQAQQQYQVEVARQQQQFQQQAFPNRRISQQYVDVPQSAAPGVTSFTNRRASQAEQLKSQLHLNSRVGQQEYQAPMTASLGGRFGGRLNPNASAFRLGGFPEEEEMVNTQRPGNVPVTAGLTTVISGGTTLGVNGHPVVNGAAMNGHSVGNGVAAGAGITPSKSDTSLNWRRGGNNSVLSGNRAASVSVRVTPPPGERTVSPPGLIKTHRPEPLRFSIVHNEPSTPLVIVDSSDGETADDGDDGSSSTSSNSEPTTPPSGGASDMPPLSPREMASKRLYEGLGIGRPIPKSAAVHTLSFPGTKVVPHTSIGSTFPTTRIISQPSRQPRGPPSCEEIGSKNFASRIRRKAIGGLGAMLDARVNRKEIEAF